MTMIFRSAMGAALALWCAGLLDWPWWRWLIFTAIAAALAAVEGLVLGAWRNRTSEVEDLRVYSKWLEEELHACTCDGGVNPEGR